MSNYSSPINGPCAKGDLPEVVSLAQDPDVTIEETEGLTIDAIKAAVLRRLGGIDQSELRRGLDILVERSPSRSSDVKSLRFAEFTETPSWVRRASAAIGRIPTLHRAAKRVYEWVAGAIASVRRPAVVRHKKVRG